MLVRDDMAVKAELDWLASVWNRAPDVVLTLPIPPSANEMNTVSRGRIHNSKKYTAWLREMGWLCQAQRGAGRISGSYAIRVTAPKMRKDLGNIEKPLSDGLQKARVVPNDRKAAEIRLVLLPTNGGKDVIVELWALP